MMQLFIEGQRADITADLPALITFAIDDIRDFGNRSTSFSKTIVLPGTANNNKLFGHIFMPGSSNDYNGNESNILYNYNAAKSADFILFEDNLQTMQGKLRLVTVLQDKRRLEYEVMLFGDIAGLNTSIGGSLLEDLDFSTYDHTYNETSIVDSWSRQCYVNGVLTTLDDSSGKAGTGYYYPLADLGTYGLSSKHDWKISTFRPALYAFEYLDKIISGAGFTYDLFTGDNSQLPAEISRFKKLIIPHNQKNLIANVNELLNFTRISSTNVIGYTLGSTTNPLPFETTITERSFSDSSKAVFTYTGSDPVTFTLKFNINYGWKAGDATHSNSITLALIKYTAAGVPTTVATQPLGNTGGYFVTSGGWFYEGSITLNTSEYFEIRATVANSSVDYLLTFEPNAGGLSYLTAKTDTNVPVQVNRGDQVVMNDVIPRNIKQIDFLVSIIKLFNLYVTEDNGRRNHLKITPYPYFYSGNSLDAVDWTYKMNRDTVIKQLPMSQLNSRIYSFRYKGDNDYYNDLYNKRYNQAYGSYKFDSGFEFSNDETSVELIFAGTPLVGYAGEDKVYPTIFKRDSSGTEEPADSNIRILQSALVESSTDYPVTSWKIYDNDGVTALSTLTKYGYAGSLDNPNSPNNDLNFGVPYELFFEIATAAGLSNTQFNIYWSAYLAEITDKDSKLLTASFYLKPSDIYQLDYSKYVIIDGVLFRLNKITDYNLTAVGTVQVELLKVIRASYF